MTRTRLPSATGTLANLVASQLTDEWAKTVDLIGSIRMRRSVTEFAIWAVLRNMIAKGTVERRGNKGAYEWRRPIVVT